MSRSNSCLLDVRRLGQSVGTRRAAVRHRDRKEVFANNSLQSYRAPWNAPPSPRPRGPQGTQPPRPAPDARPAAHRGPGHRHHAGRPARPQHRRHVLPPAPAREARLHRRGHRPRQRPRPLVAGGAPGHPHRLRDARTPEEQDTYEAYIQAVAILYGEQLQRRSPSAGSCPRRGATPAPQRLEAPADRRAGQRAGRGAARADRGDRGRGDDEDAAPFRSTSTRSCGPARWARGRVVTDTSARTPLWGDLTAVAISVGGTRVSMIAIPWFVLTTTGSATKTGLVAFAEMAPLVSAGALRPAHRPGRRAPDGGELQRGEHRRGRHHPPAAPARPAVLPPAAGAGRPRRRAARPGRRRRPRPMPALVGGPARPRAGHRPRRRRRAHRVDGRCRRRRRAGRAGRRRQRAGRRRRVVRARRRRPVVATRGIPTRSARPRWSGHLVVPRGAARRLVLHAQRPGADGDRRDGRDHQPARPGLVRGAGAGLGRDSGYGVAAVGCSARCSAPRRASARSWPRRGASGCRATGLPGGFLIAGVPRFVVLALGAPLWAVLVVGVVGGCGAGSSTRSWVRCSSSASPRR